MTEGEISTSKHRQLRRELELDAIGVGKNKFQMNDIVLAALVLVAAVISFTDFSFTLGDLSSITAITLFMYIITMLVYRNRYSRGMAKGREDEEYKNVLKAYREKRDEIYSMGIAGQFPDFCVWYKKKELREYRESLLCDVDISYEVYAEKYMKMPYREIMRSALSREAKKVIIKCNAAKSIDLYPGAILHENGEYDRHKLIGKSGRERERQDKKNQAISRAVYVIFGALVACDVFLNFEPIVIAQWVVRMLPVIIAIISGDDGGYCNITVTETAFKNGQINIMNLYEEYLKTIPKPTPTETPTVTPTYTNLDESCTNLTPTEATPPEN